MRRALAAPTTTLSSDEEQAEPGADTSLDLDPDLARIYRGPDAEAVRAKARERERQRRTLSRPRPRPHSDKQEHAITIPDDDDNDGDGDEDEDEDEDEQQQGQVQEQHHEHEHEHETISLTLTSADGTSLPVSVRPSTRIHSIRDHWLRTYPTTPAHNMRLRFQGDTLDPHSTVADADLQHDDQVEVVY